MSLLEKIPFPDCFDEKVRIVEFSEKHLTERYVNWLNDPEVVRYSEQRHYKHTIHTCLEYFTAQKKSLNYFLAIEINNSTLTHIGNIGVTIDPYNNSADMSIILGEKCYWGTGMASRAWSLVLHTLVKALGFRIITAGTMEINIPMINLMKRSGMTIDTVLPKRFTYCNNEIGLVAASYYPF